MWVTRWRSAFCPVTSICDIIIDYCHWSILKPTILHQGASRSTEFPWICGSILWKAGTTTRSICHSPHIHLGVKYSFSLALGRVSLVARVSDSQSEKVSLNLACAHKRCTFIILASYVDRDANGGPASRNWLHQWYQTLNLSLILFSSFCWSKSSSSVDKGSMGFTISQHPQCLVAGQILSKPTTEIRVTNLLDDEPIL